MGYVLILQFGVLGLIVTSIVSGVPSTIISLYWIRKNYKLTVDWGSSTKILLSSALSATLTFLLILELGFSSWIRLIIGIIFFAFVFVAASLLTKTIDKSDVDNLRGMVSGIGLIGRISNSVLNIIEKLMKILKT